MSVREQAAPAMPRPSDEEERLGVLHRYKLLEEPGSEDYTFLAELAAQAAGTPYAFVTLVDRDQVLVKAHAGLEAKSFPRDGFYCSLVVLGQDTVDIPDLTLDPRTCGLPPTVGAPHLRMYYGVALKSSDGHSLGALCVCDTAPRTLTDEQRGTLQKVARQVMALIELRANEHALHASMLALKQLATTDELTGLHNRRSLMQRLAQEAARAKRHRSPLSAVMIDLDFFKRVNDRYGHAMGDLVLENVGRMVRESVRASDIAGRYGGEELCVLLPETGLPGACKFAEVMRLKIAGLVHAGSPGVGPLTASVGVAVIDHTVGDASTLLQQADEALYRAKHSGRNRVEC
jgi:diguanylate cyclase (GGDEF)-like protein